MCSARTLNRHTHTHTHTHTQWLEYFQPTTIHESLSQAKPQIRRLDLSQPIRKFQTRNSKYGWLDFLRQSGNSKLPTRKIGGWYFATNHKAPEFLIKSAVRRDDLAKTRILCSKEAMHIRTVDVGFLNFYLFIVCSYRDAAMGIFLLLNTIHERMTASIFPSIFLLL
jgi:hypothetical protein